MYSNFDFGKLKYVSSMILLVLIFVFFFGSILVKCSEEVSNKVITEEFYEEYDEERDLNDENYDEGVEVQDVIPSVVDGILFYNV